MVPSIRKLFVTTSDKKHYFNTLKTSVQHRISSIENCKLHHILSSNCIIFLTEVKFSLTTLTLHRLWFIGSGARTFLHICRIGNFVVDRSHRRTGTEDFRLIYFRSHFRSEFVAWKFLSGSTGNKRSSDTLDSILLFILRSELVTEFYIVFQYKLMIHYIEGVGNYLATFRVKNTCTQFSYSSMASLFWESYMILD